MANQTLISEAPDNRNDSFFQSYSWPLFTIVVYVTVSLVAFTPRLFDFLTAGYWGNSTTQTYEVAPVALNTHALFGMALIPLFFVQPVLGAMIMGRFEAPALQPRHRW